MFTFNSLLREEMVEGGAGGGASTDASVTGLDSTALAADGTESTATVETTETKPEDVNPFELPSDIPGAIPETVLAKDVQANLAKTDEGREVLESYALAQAYKEAGMAIPDPATVQAAMDKAKFYDSLDADLASGDADAVLRGLTTETKDGKTFITAEGSKFIQSLPTFIAKLPDGEYASIQQPIADNMAVYFTEQVQAKYAEAQRYGVNSPAGKQAYLEADGYSRAVQAIELALYGKQSSGQDILAGKLIRLGVTGSPEAQALARREQDVTKREREVQTAPMRQAEAQINVAMENNFKADIGQVTSALEKALPMLSDKARGNLAKDFQAFVVPKILNDPKYKSQVLPLVEDAKGGDPDKAKKAIQAHQGFSRRVMHLAWSPWLKDQVNSVVTNQAERKDTGLKSSGSNGTGGNEAGKLAPFRAMRTGEDRGKYTKEREDFYWKQTVGRSV